MQHTTNLPRKRRLEWFQIFSYIVISIFSFCCLLPFWLLISGSITDEGELVRDGYAIWPYKLSLQAYQFIFSGNNQIVTSYGISIFITVVGTTLALVTTTALAYSIANRKNRLSRLLGLFVYFPMLFNGGLVPFYLLITQGLQLSDNLLAVILPLLVNPFFVFIMVSFFRKIPQELLESARLDGASEVRILVSIVLPISTPILATIGLFYALVYWNDWFMALLFLSDQSQFPLQLLLQNLIANLDMSQSLQYNPVVQVPSYQVRMALTLLTIGPIIFVYPFVQRYFIRGLTLGSTKG